MKRLSWGISFALHSIVIMGFGLSGYFSKITVPESSAPCTIPVDIQAIAPVSRALKSKPKVEHNTEQKKHKSKKNSDQNSENKEDKVEEDKVEEEVSFEDMLERLEKNNTEKLEKKQKKTHPKKQKKKSPPKKSKVVLSPAEEEIHQLLKDITERPTGPSAETPETDVNSKETYGAAETGHDIAVSILDRVQTLLQNAWRLPALADNGEKLLVIVELELNPDATVAKANIVGGTTSHPAYAIAAESAVAAAFDPSCNPLPLPPGHYHQWKKLRVTFTPH